MTADIVTPRGRHHRRSAGVLPVPPSDREKASVAWRSLPVLAAAVAAVAVYLIVVQIWAEISQPILAIFSFYTVVFIADQCLRLPVNMAARTFDRPAHVRRVAAWRPAAYPDVDICLPICAEPMNVVRNTWTGVFELVHEYPGCIRVFVLDDGPSDEARELTTAFGFSYLRRPDSRQFGKAGNLQHAFGRTGAPVLVVLDADVRPRADFLAETLPYLDDPTVGIVQTPRLLRVSPDRAWVERAAAPVLTMFGRSGQVARDRFAAALCEGSNVVFRRAALTAAGGFTLAQCASAARTGLGARNAGYRLKYVPLPLAAGRGPATLDAFARLQYRRFLEATLLVWTRQLWHVPMPLSSRLPYLAAWLTGVLTALSTLTLPLVPVVLLGWLPGDVRPANALLLAPALLSWVVLDPLWRNSPCRPRSWALSLASGWAQALAGWDVVRGRTALASGSGRATAAVRGIWYGIIGWNGGLGLVWLGLGAWRIAQTGSWRFSAATLLSVINLAVVVRLMIAGHGRR